MNQRESHYWTDRKLAAMEKRLEAIYGRAGKEMQAKLNRFLAELEERDEKRRQQMLRGEITQEEYQRWRRSQFFQGELKRKKIEALAEDMLHTNETALAYINGELPEIYATSYNSFASTAESAVKGYSWELKDRDTVKRLAAENRTFLPYKKINGRKDVRWNTKKINAEILQGILQGERIGEIASRLEKVSEMNRVSAVRNARTMVTSAENLGRNDSYERAQKDGMLIVREWLATKDGRVRHAHNMLCGQRRAVGEYFEATDEHGILQKILYPGDPNAAPSMVYNCRCTTVAHVVGFKSTLPKHLQGKIKVRWIA